MKTAIPAAAPESRLSAHFAVPSAPRLAAGMGKGARLPAMARPAGAVLGNVIPSGNGRQGPPRAIRQRTVLVTKAGAIGFAVGFVLAVVRMFALDPAPARLGLIGAVAAVIAGATVGGIVIGLLLARSVPGDAMTAMEFADGHGFLLTTTLTVLLGVVVAVFIQAGAGGGSGHARADMTPQPLSGAQDHPRPGPIAD